MNMAIKWEDVKVGVSPITSSIFIGKTKVEKDGLEIWTDRSDDKKHEILLSVIEWFMVRYKYHEKDSIEIVHNGKKLKLTYTEEDFDGEQGEFL